jgi:SAM-dependent methyltransferase
MNAQHHEAILDYFRDKADSYDLVDDQVYWRLSDELLWVALVERILPRLRRGFRFLDAGGGTGRWTDRVARKRPDASGLLFDLSPHMTRTAAAKADRGGYRHRIQIRNGALERVDETLAGERFHLILMLHNVLGFVHDPGDVVRRLARLLDVGGRLVVFAPNRYHATYFNLATGRLGDAECASRGRGRFTPEMPSIWLFTPSELRALLASAGLRVEWMTGFPSVVYPGFEETQIEGSSAGVGALLGDSANFERVLEIERSLIDQPDIAARGNNLLAIGTTQPDEG